MTTDPRIMEISAQLARPESVESVQAILARIDRLSGEPELWLHIDGWIRRAFNCLQELTAADPTKAASMLLGELLPRCLRPDTGGDPQKLPRYDIVFGEWLQSLSEERRNDIRQVSIPLTLNALDGEAVRNALRLIGSTGYWDDGLLRRLDELISTHDDDAGDQALSVRVWLCPAKHRAPWLLEQLHKRIVRGLSRYRVFAASAIAKNRLATSETAEAIWTHWLAPRLVSASDMGRDIWFDLALGILGEIAIYSQDGTLPARVWGWLLQQVRAMPGRPENNLLLTSGLPSQLNVADVIPELLRLAQVLTGHLPYVYYSRLRECILPAHLAAWITVSLSNFNEARRHATTPTGMTGKFSTAALDQKEAAWDVILCRAEPSLLPPFAEALAGEQSGFVLQRFLELAGCIALSTLPPEVSELLASAPTREAWSDQERLIAQIGAIRTAHGAASREAFIALLGYRQVGPGVLLSLVDALAEIAMVILGTGDRTAASQLLEAAESAPRDDTRGACAAAVAVLLEQGDLIGEEVAHAATIAIAPGTDPYARRELLFAFATRDPDEVPVSLFGYASNTLDRPPEDEDRDPRPAALTLLARRPNSRSDIEFLTRRLGLLVSNTSANAGPQSLGGVIPHIVGRYFVAEPERFGPAVASIISEGDTAAFAHILPAVREVGSKCTGEVIEALVARLRRADQGFSAELPLIDALARVAPDRVLVDCSRKINAWLPQARADLADTLGHLTSLPVNLELPRFDLLVSLAGDGIYAVRRAAYRAAASCDPERLAALMHSWAEWRAPGREGPRRRAAECAGWLSAGITDSIRALGWDQEKSVREAYRRSIDESNERIRSKEYEERVLSVQNPSEVIGCWRYGVALSQVGDDSTICRLANRLAGNLPASVRFWLTRIRNVVERRWRDITQKWPEPWLARPGHLESFAGAIRTGDREISVSGTLWLMQADHPSELSSWGGWGTTKERHTSVWPIDDGELVIPGHRQAKVIITSSQIPAGRVVFSGTGQYPSAS